MPRRANTFKAKEAVDWSKEAALKLIDMYRARPVLWDCTAKHYREKEPRIAAFTEIATAFGLDKAEVERKIRNLLSHYLREIKKERATANEAPPDVYKSKWFGYQRMSFLNDRCKPGRNGDDNDDDSEMSDSGLVIDDDNSNDSIYSDDSQKVTSSGYDSFILSHRKRPLSNLDGTTTMRVTRSAARRDEEEQCFHGDEYSLFGEQVAIKLRRLQTTYSKAVAQHLINITLFEAEMGKYDNPSEFTAHTSAVRYTQ